MKTYTREQMMKWLEAHVILLGLQYRNEEREYLDIANYEHRLDLAKVVRLRMEHGHNERLLAKLRAKRRKGGKHL